MNKRFILLFLAIGGVAFALQVWPTLYSSEEWYTEDDSEITTYKLVKTRMTGKIVRQVKIITLNNLPMEKPWNGELPKGAKEFRPELFRAFLSVPGYMHFALVYVAICVISLILGEFILIGKASKIFKIISWSMMAIIVAFAFGYKYF